MNFTQEKTNLVVQIILRKGVDSTQSSDIVPTAAVVATEKFKCTGDTSGALHPSTTTSSSSSYYSYPQAGEYAPRLGTCTQWGSTDGTSSKSPPNKDYITQFSMSGGPPPHPHGRQAPPNSAWNHLQVPNFYPTRQPQHAHMSSELPMLASHQPTWHTPTTTEPSKGLPHSPLFNLQQMLVTERPFPRHSPGVDLTLTRNGSQNGEIPQTPISLSVRDAKQINSLPVGAALDGDRAVELTKGPSPVSGECQPKGSLRRPLTKRMDSIIDRLTTNDKCPQSVIVTAASSSHDENSNSSLCNTVVAHTVRDDDVASLVSNEDSLDSNKSRRKRKPCKTIKVSKDEELIEADKFPVVVEAFASPDPVKEQCLPLPVMCEATPELIPPVRLRRRSSSEPPLSPSSASKSRRKTVSESETIDNIAAMVVATSKDDIRIPRSPPLPAATTTTTLTTTTTSSEPIKEILLEEQNASPEAENIPTAKAVSVIIRDHSNCSSDTNLNPATSSLEPHEETNAAVAATAAATAAAAAAPLTTAPVVQKKPKPGDTQCFVAVEYELEKMFAGIADSESDQLEADPLAIPSTSTSQLVENVSSTSNDVTASLKSSHKRGRPKGSKNGSRRPSESNSTDGTPRKKHKTNKKRDELDESPGKSSMSSKSQTPQKSKKSKKMGKVQLNNKPDVVKDVYSYDSNSNASSSRSKGPFIQIKGPRDSPISVSIVNTASNEDEPKVVKNKKFHDDSEYRHKVRSKGLHCSTLSNKYDAQTRDASWICVFCKRGPHATDPQLPGPSPFTLDLPQYSPGDLFGPYIITIDCPEYQRRVDDPFDTQFKSKRMAAAMTSPGGSGRKSKKRHNSESSVRNSLDGCEVSKDVMFGIAEATSTTFEVWVHEDCVIWGPGVYLVGPKIMGLEGAVWGACSVACKRCCLKGAAVCCLKRGCASVMHIGCAKLSNWKLDEENYKAYCKEHTIP